MNVVACSIKIRFLTIVLNTANLINEVSSPPLGITHSLIAPVTIFTTYIFLSIFVFGAIRNKYASRFLQMYGLVACCTLQISLSIAVFNGFKLVRKTRRAPLVLSGLLPIISICLLLSDLVMTALYNRNRTLVPPPSSSVAE